MALKEFYADRPLDLICMGRVAVDFYCQQIGSPLEAAQSFNMYLGGCPGNIAVAGSRLGLKTAMLSRVGSDDLGKFVRQTLEREGVDTSMLRDDPEHLTALVVLGVQPPDRFPLIFYRENCADMQLCPTDCNPDTIRKSKALLISGTGLSTERMRQATHAAIAAARTLGTALVLDIDYRPVLWKLTKPGDGETRFQRSSAVSSYYQEILEHIDLIVGTEEEILIAGGQENLRDALKAIQSLSAAPVVVKRGIKGCEIHFSDRAPVCGPAFPVEVLNVLGAGDAFMGGFLRAWLSGQDWPTCAKWANANGAIVVSRHGCAPAMANWSELNFFIEQYGSNSTVLAGKAIDLLHRRTELGRPREQRRFILAIDHRGLFERSAKAAGLSEAGKAIAAFKAAAFDAVAELNESAPEAGILLDPIYGSSGLRSAAQRRVFAGAPIEESEKFPLEWLSKDPMWFEILSRPRDQFVKVLFNYHPQLDPSQRAEQLRRLGELSATCEKLSRRLMLELLPPKGLALDSASCAAAISDIYSSGTYPYWWKLAGQTEGSCWQPIIAAIDRHDPDSAIVVLGGGDSIEDLSRIFSAAKGHPAIVGFAVGRTIFAPPWEDFINQRLDLAAAKEAISQRYLNVIELWRAD